jgi:S1-C subfamily serine protease
VPLSAELADGLRIPGQTGLLILSVDAGSPLGQAGVMTGDILLSADDKQVIDVEDLASRLRSRSGRVALRLLRKGTERNATVLIPR